MAAVAARTMLRSTASVSRSAAARVVSASRPRTVGSPFRFGTQTPLSARIFRSPVELSSVSVQSMMPYHSVTASALLTSMLSANPRTFGWTLEDCNDDV